MRGVLLLSFGVLLTTAGCAHAPPPAADGVLVASAGQSAAAMNRVEMPPLYVQARENYGQQIEWASTDATELCARQSGCPVVRVRRTDLYLRPDGSTWTVVRLSACGEERVYAKSHGRWSEASWRLH
jgi:hypothetical protein